MKTNLQRTKDLCEYYFRACEYLHRNDVPEEDKAPVREQLTRPLESACALFDALGATDAYRLVEWYSRRDAECAAKINALRAERAAC